MAASFPQSYRSSTGPQNDPDYGVTLSDFLSYTEHFPAHLTRALALIEDQRRRAETKIKRVHEDATTYSILPSLTAGRPDPVELRKAISYALEEAEAAARMSVEEAARLDDMCQREAKRLDVVTEKLKAQPLPPSRDPTPEQQALTSPNLKRERRMSMRGDEQKADKSSRRLTDKAATKLRGRKIMVPGEVLPPPDPNAPVESISDWTSPRASPPLEEPPAAQDKKATPRPRSRTPKVPKLALNKPDQLEKDKKYIKPRAPRQPGQPALTHPPEDAPKGSKWLPWMKLTEWEMAKLRKRMKKNAIWVPSQTMVRRELKTLGRGVSGKEAARAQAEEGGPAFVDEGGEPDPTRVELTGEETSEINAILGNEQAYPEDGEDADQELINRGMRLNEAKKLKRKRMLEEQALQEQIAREQGVEAPAGETKYVAIESKDNKKRKRESTPSSTPAAGSILDTPDPLSKPGPAPKRLKITAPTTKVPLAPAGASPKQSARSRRAATPPPVRKPTITIKASKAVSEEPPNRRASLRRTSNASLPTNGNLLSPVRAAASSSTAKTGGSRRSRRPAPGILTTGDDESAKVGVSNRRAAPHKKPKGTAVSEVPAEAFVEEYIDPKEPRYCVCGDVSWGTMIACDNEENCDKEWFHLTCVGLDELPPRRTKWYCPDCRKKLKLGVATNGLVGRTAVGGR